MKTIEVTVKSDHLESLARVKKPIIAVAELIWNGLDADAKKVDVSFVENPLGGVESIVVRDDGLGLPYDQAETAFSNLGGSWKRSTRVTRERQRLMHGRRGKGRFRAFALGHRVSWDTKYRSDGHLAAYSITGEVERIGTFRLGEVAESEKGRSGTVVRISQIDHNCPTLRGDSARQEITELFAIYLTTYPEVRITYDGKAVDPKEAIACQTDIDVGNVVLPEGRNTPVKMTVIEWRAPQERKMFLCGVDGSAYEEVTPGIQARGFNFTAHVKTELVSELVDSGAIELAAMDPGMEAVLSECRDRLRKYFRERTGARAATLLASWKKDEIYPYSGNATDPLDEARRQVFDICALEIQEFLPDFDQEGLPAKRLSFRLLRHALDTSPTALKRILSEVIELPLHKQEELAELLEKTSLDAIITAARTVADRLRFLAGLEQLLFEEPGRGQLKERSQLHRLVADQAWLFGERFNLTVSDKSLTSVLQKHLADREGEVVVDESPVTRLDGSNAIVDLMFSRSVPQPNRTRREHLVVELKRPAAKINMAAFNQTCSYAMAVAKDERFRKVDAAWDFWAVSNDMDEDVGMIASQSGRPDGVAFEKDNI
ncbi:MAG: ATP-binding protein, partial [Nitrososphaerales archaeon]